MQKPYILLQQKKNPWNPDTSKYKVRPGEKFRGFLGDIRSPEERARHNKDIRAEMDKYPIGYKFHSKNFSKLKAIALQNELNNYMFADDNDSKLMDFMNEVDELRKSYGIGKYFIVLNDPSKNIDFVEKHREYQDKLEKLSDADN